jgi:hypothetical protein
LHPREWRPTQKLFAILAGFGVPMIWQFSIRKKNQGEFGREKIFGQP